MLIDGTGGQGLSRVSLHRLCPLPLSRAVRIMASWVFVLVMYIVFDGSGEEQRSQWSRL